MLRSHLDVQLLNLLAAGMLLISFAMLSTRRTQQLITLFAWQGTILFLSTSLVAHEAGLTELYFSAALTLILKVITLPLILQTLIKRLGAQWDNERLVNIPITMLVGLVLVIFAFGLAQPISLIATAFFLWRQRDIKRLFGYSSIEHMGIITFAFGLGGPVANFAALLHMTVHSLTKSSIFFTAGHASQTAGTQQMDGIRGLVGISPTIGWGLMLGSLAILGMPPFGVFASEFLILTTAMREHPWATPFLLLVLGIAFAGIFMKVQPMVFGESDAPKLPHSPALVPVFVHLAMVLVLGLYIPPALAEWYRAAARLIG